MNQSEHIFQWETIENQSLDTNDKSGLTFTNRMHVKKRKNVLKDAGGSLAFFFKKIWTDKLFTPKILFEYTQIVTKVFKEFWK